MLRGFLSENSIGKRGFLVITILFLSVFGWYYMTLPVIESILNKLSIPNSESVTIWATFYVSIIATSIIGTFLSKKVSRHKFLYAWTILGAVASLLPILFSSSFDQVRIVSLLLGASFGLGIPSCLAYFAECTSVENRGRVGCITFLIANITAPFLSILGGTFDLVTISVIFALLRLLGLSVFFFNPEKQSPSQVKTNISFISILRERTFLLYFVVWSMFPLVDSFERVLVDNYLTWWNPELLNAMGIVEPLVAGLSILGAGFLCDWIGRKKIVLSGLIAIGIAYGMIGLIPQFEFSWYLYFVVDATAWGIFSLIFYIIIWGDIAQSRNSEKYYTLGSIPYFISSIIPLLLTTSFIENVEVSAAFSVASFFLFAAVMPLVFAPETLPEKKIELRRLRSFAEDAKKMKEKYEEKRKK
ncbi:MAG: MFS transporter [Candidatus Bathyarchaeia archaeon]|jgi:MFS family permease